MNGRVFEMMWRISEKSFEATFKIDEIPFVCFSIILVRLPSSKRVYFMGVSDFYKNANLDYFRGWRLKNVSVGNQIETLKLLGWILEEV